MGQRPAHTDPEHTGAELTLVGVRSENAAKSKKLASALYGLRKAHLNHNYSKSQK